MSAWKNLLCVACVIVTGTLPLAAFAQTYPTKPVRIIIPFAPGGGADYIARPLGPKLMEVLGQPVILDNRGGANGVIGTDVALKATPDGYTLFFGSAGVLTIGPALTPGLNYVPERDFLPIALLRRHSLLAHRSCLIASEVGEGTGGLCPRQSWQTQVRRLRYRRRTAPGW